MSLHLPNADPHDGPPFRQAVRGCDHGSDARAAATARRDHRTEPLYRLRARARLRFDPDGGAMAPAGARRRLRRPAALGGSHGPRRGERPDGRGARPLRADVGDRPASRS